MPPAHHADFGPPREDGLELSPCPDAPRPPLVTRDAKPVPRIQAPRAPWPAQPGQPSRDADADERVGTANVLLLPAPLTGWRTIAISAQRTAVDGAHQSKPLLADCFPDADKVTGVCDPLNTPTIAALSAAWAPPEARRRARRLEVHDTPKHGRWWHSAEIALRVLTKPCLERRLPALET
jgi:hypothetical protein